MAKEKLWGGRFHEGTAASVEAYTQSISYDWALYKQDIAGSCAHARMLARQGVISAEEADQLVAGLAAVRAEIEDGTFQWKKELEDVHMNIESRLTELVGDVGKKLHTGRSRNDQVALDFRLFVSDRLREWQRLARELAAVYMARAEEHQDTILPGCTHLQPAQPVSLAHHLLAYAWMLRRDVQRMADCEKRTRISPLGAAALAGTTYPLDPASVARELDMYGTFDNSMDAVSDRDFVIEALFCASTAMMHLSRCCEEIILWSNPAFGFVKLPDAYATGSSIMPQKKNPDVAEIMRGKVGRVYGDLTAMLTILKGLPLTYNRDLQEDKEPFLDADHTLSTSLELMAGMPCASMRSAWPAPSPPVSSTRPSLRTTWSQRAFPSAKPTTSRVPPWRWPKGRTSRSKPCRLTRFRACAIASAPMCSTCSNTAPPSPAGTPPAAPARCPWRASWKR